MKPAVKTISVILTFCLIFSTITIYADDTVPSATLTANKTTVQAGETVNVSFAVNGLKDISITSGQIAIDISEQNYSNLFEISDEVTWKDGIAGNKLENSEDYDFAYSFAPTAEQTVTINDDNEVIFTFSLTIKSDAVQTEDKSFQLSVDSDNTYIMSGHTRYNFSESNVTIDIETNETPSCDLDGSGSIDFMDFHALCVLINNQSTDAKGDLNKDGKVDKDDVSTLIEAYKSQSSANTSSASSSSASASMTLYLDTSDINPILPVKNDNPSVFELPVKAVNSLSGSGLFTTKLIMNFDEEYIEADDIKGNATNGIEGLKKLDNDKGIIEYWYCFNGSIPSDNVIATADFKVISKGDAEVKINDTSKFYNKDSQKINTSYSDDDDKNSNVSIKVGSESLAKPVFSTTTTTFVSSLTVKFASRTDGATIYYKTSSNGSDPDEDDEVYTSDGITIRNTTTIRAIAIKNGVKSSVASKTFTRVRPDGGSSGGSSKTIVVAPATTTPTPTTTPTTTEAESKFSDLSDHWSKGFIHKLVAKGIINGYEDGTVRPDNKITRAEAAKIIICALNVNPSETANLTFADSSEIADWAKGYIQKAVEMGIMTGYEDNTFKPTQNVSRKELIVIATRAFALNDGNADELTFADKDTIPDWAKQSIATALKHNIVKGFEDNTFKPDNFVTRGESSKIISLCMDLK